MESQNTSSPETDQLSFFDFFDFDEERRVILFSGRRQVFADAGFLGILHRELIRVQGWRRSRGILLRVGFATGFTDCQTMRKVYTWEDDQKLLRAGMTFYAMKGIARPKVTRIEVDRAGSRFRLEGVLIDSQEAQWHKHLLGAAPAPVCWLQTGYLSGFASAWWGGEVLASETSCSATGRTNECTFLCLTAGEWDEDRQEELDMIRYPALGDDLSKMGDFPIPRPSEKAGGTAGGVADVFKTARSVGIIGRSKALEQALKLALQVAPTDTSVLLVGESGTGKELFANLIHEESTRDKAPFIAVNCSALPEPLLESELFGHVKGSFTGAVESRKGLFEAADPGTLLLDEIGEMTPATQVKLLRVLQEKEVRPVGGNLGTPINVRIIAATNRDLDRMVAEGHFREDLYYRLKVFPIEIPPLRVRREDVVPLARNFLARFSRTTGKKVNSLTPGALKVLSNYVWPGNVRELENMLERAVVLTAGDRISEEDLPLDAASEGHDLSLVAGEEPVALKDMERHHILRVLGKEGGHRQRTAKALGIGVNTLWRKLKEYGVERNSSGQ